MLERICGVALILSNGFGRVFVLKELQSKPRFDKHRGDLSIPMETSLDGEFPEDTLERLLIEEVGMDVCLVDVEQVGVYDLFGCVDLTVFHARYGNGKLFEGVVRDELETIGWMAPEELLNRRCRGGVGLIMTDYLKRWDRVA